MEPTDGRHWRARAHSFLFGDYPGAPIAYVMALAIVLAMIAVTLLSLLVS